MPKQSKTSIMCGQFATSVFEYVMENKNAFKESKKDETILKLKELLFEQVPKRTVSKKLKDPNAPKRPLNAHMRYAREVRDEVKTFLSEQTKEKPKMADVNKEIGNRWKALAPKDRKKYEKEYEKEKEEYDEKMAEYERPSDEELAKLDVNQKKTRGKKVKDPDEPSLRGKTAYQFFVSEKKQKVKEDHPGKSVRELNEMLKDMWEEVEGTKEIKKYRQMEKEEKERLKKVHDEWLAKKASKSEEKSKDDEDEKPKKKKSSKEDSDDEDEKPKKKKSSKEDSDDEDEKKPKKKKSKSKEDSDDEDEKKPKKKKSKSKEDSDDEDEKPKKKKSSKEDSDDEDEKPASLDKSKKKKSSKKSDDDE